MNKYFLNVAVIGVFFVAVATAQKIELTIDTSKPGAKIDRNIFGQFAEHLGFGVYEGIWVGKTTTRCFTVSTTGMLLLKARHPGQNRLRQRAASSMATANRHFVLDGCSGRTRHVHRYTLTDQTAVLPTGTGDIAPNLVVSTRDSRLSCYFSRSSPSVDFWATDI